MLKSENERKEKELEKVYDDNSRLKTIIDDQMVIAERQREKLIAAREEEMNLQKDLQTLHKSLMEAENQQRLSQFQIDRLRKQVKANNTEKKDSTKMKELSE